VAATPLSAPIVLARVAEVLVQERCAFKFGTDIARVAQLAGPWYDRGGSGKFITVYPGDDDQFRVVAERLHQVTFGLAGPSILSDRQLHPGSLVHYRYGVFMGEPVFTDDGEFESRMVGPDGTVVKDERQAWFTPPPWAVSPFDDEPVVADVSPETVLIGGRFRVTEAIRHANKGGVYVAVDERDGGEVVIKQARAYVGSRLDATDVRDRLREEARVLEVLAPLALFPAPVALFEEHGDLFLAEELIPGMTLEEWAFDRVHQDGALNLDDAAQVVGRLVSAVRSVHQAGLVIRDLKPQNVMVTPLGEIRLIDAEHVAEPGQMLAPVFTPGFAAPELRAAIAGSSDRPIPVPGPPADCFSLGVTVFCTITGLDPHFVSGRQRPRPDADRGRLLSEIAEDHPILAVFAGLTETSPGRRWSPAQAEEYVRAMSQRVAAAVPLRARFGSRLQPASLDRLLTDGLEHLRQRMTPNEPTLWPSDDTVKKSDPCDAWRGAAGVLATFTHAAQVLDDDGALHETVAEAAAWIDERLYTVPRLLPGLCFGRAGTAWALYDAADLLEDEKLRHRAVELATKLPTEGPSPDVTHGLSGAGLAHLHLWQVTEDRCMLERALVCADSVLAAACRDGEDWLWSTSTAADSSVAGHTSYGFAHGVAGVGAFLLAVAEAATRLGSDRGRRFMEAALGAGDTLARAARISDRIASWSTPGGSSESHSEWQWCNGPVGIGTFLIRLWAATGEQRFGDIAERCAPPPKRRWRSIVNTCCGLAGSGHFLLDLAELTGQQYFRDQAEDIGHIIHTQSYPIGGLRLACPPEHGLAYGWGIAGTLDFLLRLRHGGPRPWMPYHRPFRAVQTPGTCAHDHFS
jgi:serine/threonine protein kinase